MYEIEFYQLANGREPVREYLKSLQLESMHSKSARIRYEKTFAYMQTLERVGTRCGMPFVKYMGHSIWELRPTSDRYFFAYWKDNKFLVLHHYVKQSQKTPPQELAKARACLKDYLERND